LLPHSAISRLGPLSSILEFGDQQANLVERVRVLKSKPEHAQLLTQLWTQLRRSSTRVSLSLWNVANSVLNLSCSALRSISLKVPIFVATSIASALRIAISPGDIVSFFQISVKGDRPRPLVVRLFSNAIRNLD